MIYKIIASKVATITIYLNDLKMFRRILFSVMFANAPNEKYTIQTKNIIPNIYVKLIFIIIF